MITTLPIKWSPFVPEGRTANSFVYMLLCRDEGKIYIKVGISDRPEKRFHELRNGCPVTPRTFSVIPVPGRGIAKNLEHELLEEFDQWRVSGEWFALAIEDKTDFNARLHGALKKYSRPSWKMQIDKVPAKILIQIAERRRAYWKMNFKRRGTAYRDFVKDSA